MNKINLEALWSTVDPQVYLANHIEALQIQNEALISILRAHNLHEERCAWNITKNDYKYDTEGFLIGSIRTRPHPCDCILSLDKANDSV